jgi:hypothetical protein
MIAKILCIALAIFVLVGVIMCIRGDIGSGKASLACLPEPTKAEQTFYMVCLVFITLVIMGCLLITVLI